MCLSEYTEQSLRREGLSEEILALLKKPTRGKVKRLEWRLSKEAYEKGYHQAVEDVKQICKCRPEQQV